MLHAFGMGARGARRNLASALVGEIAAVMRAIEDNPVFEEAGAVAGSDPCAETDASALPRTLIYEANAGHIGLFNAPLPREVAHFYTRVATLSGYLRALSKAPETSNGKWMETLHAAASEAACVMELGDELLHDLKPFVSAKRPQTITRA
jgi:hypothetical protein